ncbi:MAG: recombinase family protein [Clostridia bacterium]|nr:recombinase family protein [Clostridia bacterium]MBP3596579.1 recombinase family protein [Clostridia bacterium]
MKDYKAAIYLRLSKEDREVNNSIDIQREITTRYANNHKYNIVEEYIDNGYSGILSSRPALNRLMIDIIRNKIDMVIVKDMSRLTRDKNLTSYYTDIFFPDNDVRLISVTEYIDTGERYEIDDVVALRGIVNQSYLEDISNKIKAVKRNFKTQGKFIEGSVAYGYKKDKNDKHRIVVDDKVSHIIKEIYSLYIDGIGPSQIAEILNRRNIETPSQYLKLKVTGKYWTKSIINRILTNPIYAGCMVINKYESNFKLKKKNLTPKHQYKLLEDTHECIISKEDFEKAQEKKGNKTKKDYKEYIFLLKGLVYCENCGRKMTYKNNTPVRIDINGRITGKQNENGYFVCEEHYRHKDVCDQVNKTKEKFLNELVLKKVSNRLKELQIGKYAKEVQELRDKQDPNMCNHKKLKSEIDKKENEMKILYSKKVEGIISEEVFLKQYKLYQETTNNLKEKLDKLQKNENSFNSKTEIDRIIIAFSDAKKFDNTILKKLIEKIEIGKNNKIIITLKV